MTILNRNILSIPRTMILWFCGGLLAYPIEGLWRIHSNGGWVSIYMLPVYGMALLGLGLINRLPIFYNRKIIVQSAIGAIFVLIIEFIAGLIINRWLGLDVWDYSSSWGNIMGQITPLFGFFWFLIIPFGIWAEDFISWMNWREGWNYKLRNIYKDFFTFK